MTAVVLSISIKLGMCKCEDCLCQKTWYSWSCIRSIQGKGSLWIGNWQATGNKYLCSLNTGSLVECNQKEHVQSSRASQQPYPECVSFQCWVSDAKYFQKSWAAPLCCGHKVTTLCKQCALPNTIICANIFPHLLHAILINWKPHLQLISQELAVNVVFNLSVHCSFPMSYKVHFLAFSVQCTLFLLSLPSFDTTLLSTKLAGPVCFAFLHAIVLYVKPLS